LSSTDRATRSPAGGSTISWRKPASRSNRRPPSRPISPAPPIATSARRNFGVCFAYALAKATEERLLFKGEDFGSTDIRPYR
jgi:hypothetical protein